ncbi:MAG: triose-phosphate isomerase [Patescibacteria group bacterium]
MGKILIANWKANPATLQDAEHLFHAEMKATKKFPQVTVVICPPFVYLARYASHAAVELGAQDVHWEDRGPHTGEVSPLMLKELGVRFVLVGHSERRALGETDEMVNKKLKAVLQNGMIPVLLIGEPEKGPARSDYLIDQLTRDLEGIDADGAKKILFTYEPVWAISTNPGAQPATPEDALSAIHEMQAIISKMYGFAPEVLYGGSANVENIAGFLSHPEICGAVVGGASLHADEFGRMIDIVAQL